MAKYGYRIKRGEVVVVEDRLIAWTGSIDAIVEAGSFDTLFCHDDGGAQLVKLALAVKYEVGFLKIGSVSSSR